MVFARKVWKLLVAIKDGLVLLFLLLFFVGLYAALTMRPSVSKVQDGALLLELDGSIVEEPRIVSPVRQLLSQEELPTEFRARDVVRALHLAAHDKRIKAVVLDLTDFLGGGQVSLQDVGAALDEVRAAHKPVLTFGPAFLDDGMVLAAHSSEVWIDPMGGAFVTGPGGYHLYYGGLLDKLKIQAHVFRVGTYKSAVEPFIRSDQSPAAKQAATALYGALWSDWQADVAKARPKAEIARVTSDPAAWLKASDGDAAKAAKAAGLVDRIGDRAEFGKRVAEIVGKDSSDTSPGSFAHTALPDWLAANPPKTPGKAIGVVTIAGEIVDGDAGPGTAGGDRIAGLLNDARDENLAALVVRVDSPGGSIFASEEIRRALMRYKAKGIPVVVSMANLAASGGFWVSTPAQRIFAEPATITGSIGVFAIIPTFEKALASIGVTSDGVRTTPLSGQPDPISGLTPEVSAMIQANIDSSYARFVGLVAKSRGKTPDAINEIAQGRVWDGGTARQLGLVDQFGGLDDALAYAAKAAGLSPGQWHPEYLGTKGSTLEMLLGRLGTAGESASIDQPRDWAALVSERQLGLARRVTADVDRLTNRPGVQAYCLECPREPLVAADGRGALPAFLARLAALAQRLP